MGSDHDMEQPPPVHEEPARGADLAAVERQYADLWTARARRPDHDSCRQFGRDAVLPLLLPPVGRLTLDVGCGEGRVSRGLRKVGHRVVSIDRSPTLVGEAAAAARGLPALAGDAVAMPPPAEHATWWWSTCRSTMSLLGVPGRAEIEHPVKRPSQ